jgi:hypothetical protein
MALDGRTGVEEHAIGTQPFVESGVANDLEHAWFSGQPQRDAALGHFLSPSISERSAEY